MMKICEAGRDSCGCNNWSKGIRTIDGQYPDDNREFKIVEGAGILITPVTAGIKITNITDPGALEAGQNIQLTPNGDKLQIGTTDDIHVNGDLNVDGDIIQQGASYETHMEQVYTTDDYITMRDGAVSALGSGQYAGFQVKKYDGTNDGRLVIDNTGTARVGDVGDEQPLLTREESANLTNGALLKWDGSNMKAVDEGTVGDDTHPVKIVNGVATPVTNALMENVVTRGTATLNTTDFSGGTAVWVKFGHVVMVSIRGVTPINTGVHIVVSNLPISDQDTYHDAVVAGTVPMGNIWIDPYSSSINFDVANNSIFWKTFVYMSKD